MIPSEIKLAKSELRAKLRQLLANLSTEQKQNASASICSQIVDFVKNRPQIQTVASFAHLPSEPDLSNLHVLLPEHRIVYPHAVAGGSMTFHEVSSWDSLAIQKRGIFKLRQPDPDQHPLTDVSAIDLILCPAYAYTRAGKRLGKGGGYYDRILATRSASSMSLGVCFDCQVLTSIPTEAHDITIQHIISSL